MSISIGPLAFPFQPFLLLLSYWLANWLAAKWAAPERAQAAKDAVQSAFWAGLIGARFAFLVEHAMLYVDNPWAVIDIHDGGWNTPVGFVAAAAWLLWRLRDQLDLRYAVWRAVLAGGVLWGAGTIWAELQRVAEMPEVPLVALDKGRTQNLTELRDGRLWWSTCGHLGVARAVKKCPLCRKRSKTTRTFGLCL